MHRLRHGGGARAEAVVVSRDAINAALDVVVAALSGDEREGRYPTAVELAPGDAGVEGRRWVLCHELATVPPEALEPFALGSLPPGKLVEVERKLRSALDL